VPDALDGERLDRVVAMVTGESRSAVRALVEAGAVRVDGMVSGGPAERVRADSVVEVDVPVATSGSVDADPAVDVPVVHADDHVIVVDKPAGLVVHPGAGQAEGTLVQGILARFPEVAAVGDPARPGIVHRLDRGTSGLLVVARSTESYDDIVDQLGRRRVTREYLALVWGRPEAPVGLVDAPIGRSAREPTRMAVSNRGREARTGYEVVASHDEPEVTALVRCHLETGRTHQIRVHLAAIGHPVAGDERYGGARPAIALDRPFLHATHLAFAHPVSGEELAFDSPLPPDLSAVLDRLAARS
jgi:23S rRNA pseudouridine1911/1915/1917 synthase